MREQVELLEDHADLGPDAIDLPPARLDRLAVERDRARVDRLEAVDAAEHRGLPGAGRARDDHCGTAPHLQVDPIEDDVLTEALANAGERHQMLNLHVS